MSASATSRSSDHSLLPVFVTLPPLAKVASVKGWGQLGAYEDNEFYEEVHFMNMRRLYNEALGKKTPGRPRARAIKQ